MKKAISIGLLVLVVSLIATTVIVSAENPYEGGPQQVEGDDVGVIEYAQNKATCPWQTISKCGKERGAKVLELVLQGKTQEQAYEETWPMLCKCFKDNFCQAYAEKNFEQCKPKEEPTQT